jgi:glutaredoxin 2
MSNSSSRLEIRLKEREDEYIHYKQFYVLVGTFNVNNRQAPANILLEQWLHQVTHYEESKEQYIPDIIAVGFQEIDTSSGAYIYDDKKKEDEWEQLVKKTISACYETKNEEENIQFELLNRVRLMGRIEFLNHQDEFLL